MSWQEDYLVALRARDEREQSDKTVIDAYTKLADRSAILETSKKSTSTSRVGNSSQHGTPSLPSSSPNPGIPRPLVPPPNTKTGGGPSITTLQSDLGEAQSQRAELQEQVAVLMAERDRARTQLRAESGRSRALEAERAALASKLRDRDEELRGKAKLLDDVQNETVTLEMQLNVTEEKNKDLKAENKELVDRWMARMGEEADKMNLESKFT